MAPPSATEPWGWQLDGHHAIINYFVLGDQVVMTPTFFGSEPVRAHAGTYKGTTVLQDEQQKGLAMINALTDAQRTKAIIQISGSVPITGTRISQRALWNILSLDKIFYCKCVDGSRRSFCRPSSVVQLHLSGFSGCRYVVTNILVKLL